MNKNNNINITETIVYMINSLFPILCGIVFYGMFRPGTMICIILKDYFHIVITLPIETIIELNKNVFINVLICYLCDFLWAYSFAWSLLYVINKERVGRVYIFVICICSDIAVELLQRDGFFVGTYDSNDIVIQLIGTTLAFLLNAMLFREGNRSWEV